MASSLATFGLRPANGPALLFNFPSRSIIDLKPRLFFWPISKSTGSWLGVILRAPVPNSISTPSSATTTISRLVIGSITFLPIQVLYLLS